MSDLPFESHAVDVERENVGVAVDDRVGRAGRSVLCRRRWLREAPDERFRLSAEIVVGHIGEARSRSVAIELDSYSVLEDPRRVNRPSGPSYVQLVNITNLPPGTALVLEPQGLLGLVCHVTGDSQRGGGRGRRSIAHMQCPWRRREHEVVDQLAIAAERLSADAGE